MKDKEGYLTVFLSLILTVMISLCLTLLLGARENTRCMEIECVTDIAMNNILAEYHRELLKQYNLFFIDTSYGTPEASFQNTAKHLREYIDENMSGEKVFLSIVYRDPLKLKLDGLEITEVSAAPDDGGAVLRRQAVDVMYQRVGISYLEQIQNWLLTVQEYELDSRDVFAEQKEASAALEEWNGNMVTADGAEQQVTIKNPAEKVTSVWEAGALNFVVGRVSELSTAGILAESCLSARELLTGTGINPTLSFADGWWEQLIFQEYIMAYTGHYTEQKEESCLKYQTEYILSGKDSDIENLKNVVYTILAIRAAANLVYLLSDKEKMQMAEVAATIFATLLTIPEAAVVFQVLLILTWAMAESLYDVQQLLAGRRVSLLKSKTEWHYSLEGMLDLGNNDEEAKDKNGLLYEDYLRILLCFQEKKIMTYRLMDIMEMDIRMTPGNQYFRMDGCIDSLKAAIQFSGRDGKVYHIERRYGY